MHPPPNPSRPERPEPVWTVVLTAAQRPEAELIVGRLRAEGIPAVLLDQGSSAYPSMLGQVSVLVDRTWVLKALHLLQQPAP